MAFAITSQIIETSVLWLKLLSDTKVKVILIFSQNDVTRWCGLFLKVSKFEIRTFIMKTENSAVYKNKDSAENNTFNGSTYIFI